MRDSPQRAREATLRADLFTFRSVIDQYKGDKGNYPPDLETLVTDGYMRKIPFDPMTKAGRLGADDGRGALRARRPVRDRAAEARDHRRPQRVEGQGAGRHELQGVVRRGRAGARGGPASGFTLVGVVVAIAILTILIAAIGPSIATVMQRDKEIELIFRGKQYARAILAFQRRYGRYPNELKELAEIKPRSIRQLWKEPMCNCDGRLDSSSSRGRRMRCRWVGPAAAGGGMPGSGTALAHARSGQGNQPPSTYTGIGDRHLRRFSAAEGPLRRRAPSRRGSSATSRRRRRADRRRAVASCTRRPCASGASTSSTTSGASSPATPTTTSRRPVDPEHAAERPAA